MRIAQEEIFGPVLSVIPFEDEEEAIAIGNDIVFGLAAGVWTSDIGRALRMSEKLKAGTIWVNTYRAVSFMSPFGGYKPEKSKLWPCLFFVTPLIFGDRPEISKSVDFEQQ